MIRFRHLFLTGFTACAAPFTAAGAHAEEGMWTFDNSPSAKVKAACGVTIDKAWVDHVQGAAVALAAMTAFLVAGEGRAAVACAPAGSEVAAVKTVSDMYAAATVDDETGFRANITRGFYAYDNGRRFDGLELFNLVKTLHAQGSRFEWKVTEPALTVSCDLAVVAYVNRGAAGDAKAMTPMRWLESATLRYEDGRWRIAFMQSQRAAQ